MEGVLVGLIWLLIYAVVVALVCYVVARLVAQFLPGASAFTWIVWCIGGIVVLILALRLFAPVLGG